MQGTEQVYAELPPSLRKRLLPLAIHPSASTSQQKAEPRKAAAIQDVAGLIPVVARASVGSKLSQRPVALANPPKESDRRLKGREVAAAERRKRKIANRRRRSGRLVTDRSLREATSTGVAQCRPLIKGHVCYELLLPLHNLWLGYISELLAVNLRTANEPEASTSSASQSGPSTSRDSTMTGDPQSQATSSDSLSPTLHQMQIWQGKLVKADFHGCKVEVVKAKHPSLVGLAGIVAQETEGTLRIVTAKNAVKVVPKKDVTFAFSLPLSSDSNGDNQDLRFELHGSNFGFKSADRASKKFKAKGAKGLEFC